MATLVACSPGPRGSPSPVAPGDSSALLGVSCPTPASCLAAGWSETEAGARRALTERWSRSGWTLLPPPSPGSDTLLRTIACASATFCLAGGSTGVANEPELQRALVESWNGSAWSVRRLPLPAGPSAIQAVECASDRDCKVLGWSSGTGVAAPFVESWDGRAWSTVELPVPSEGANAGGFLEAIACPRPAACVAVGLLSTNDGGDGTMTLAERWAGGRWSVAGTASPAILAGDLSALESVACGTVSRCLAVGSYAVGNVFNTEHRPLVEAGDGSAWSQVLAAPLPAATQGELDSIACAGPQECLAAGWTADAAGRASGLAEAWDGHSWSVAPAPALSGRFEAVACPATGTCLLVGERTTPSAPRGQAAAAWWLPGTR